MPGEAAKRIEKREGVSKRRQLLIFALSGLVVVVAVLSLWLGWGSVVTSGQIGAGPMALVIRTPTPITPLTSVLLPTSTPYPTYTPHPTHTSYPTPSPYPTYTPYPTPATSGVPTTLTLATDTPASTPTPAPTPTPTETPMSTPTPIIIVVTATPVPTPTPTPFPAPRLIGPENEYKFFEGDASRIILQWESVGPLAENEWYQVILIFFKLGETQYRGVRLKESEWQVPAYFHGQADQPKRAYYWNVTVVQVDKDSDGTEMCLEQSPSSETWTFYWP
jgi:hypothetical protein